MKVPLQRNITINTLLKQTNVTSIKIATEPFKVNLPVVLVETKGFLTLELLIALFLCVLLSTMVMRYQWYAITWQAHIARHWQVLHTVEAFMQEICLNPSNIPSGCVRDGVTLTVEQEGAKCHLLYVHARWPSLVSTNPHTITVPVTMVAVYEQTGQ